MNTENRIVAGHDGSDMSLFDCFPECREIYFMKCPLIHVGTCMMAAPFLIVGRKMFDGGDNAFRLYTFYIICSAISEARYGSSPKYSKFLPFIGAR